MAIYDPQKFEAKWQQAWEKAKLFQGTTRQSESSHKDPLYLLFAFAYPSGSGLHVGHVESTTALDILARFNRMNGKDVFFPVGWDAFGLPAENYAIKTGVHPAETTRSAIDTFRQQLQQIGVSYDWQSEIATSHPGYYRWTQWLFLELFKQGLAYQGTAMVNWCPSCQTVLANEQVVNGQCERCGHDVTQKEMKQWFFKITDYKDELIDGLEQLDWPKATKDQQINWIGRSEGAMIDFAVEQKQANSDDQIKLKCFTTRIDTIYGVTFLAISPEKFREFGLKKLLQENKQEEVDIYIENAYSKTEEERKIGEKDKTGVDTGLTVVNPVSGQVAPLYVADYVLAGYGTGVVMGVPAHDERDLKFAEKFDIPVVSVIRKADSDGDLDENEFHSEYGTMINSDKFDGISSEEAMQKIPAEFDEVDIATTYKLRDWLISRQRYWGAPIPIVYDPEGKAHPIRDEHLPWQLPTDVDFKPTGESPLKSSKEFIERTERLYGKGWTPEFDTMDTFVDSSWYYLRYCDARNENEFASKERLEHWLPVDFYMIGPEHIVLHLLYSRFFTKFLRDQGYLSFDEPFLKMRHQGMILGPDGKKMSKSKGNVINPDEIIAKFGADTLRMYEMFLGPIDADKPWDVRAVVGIYRFLTRVNNQILNGLSTESLDNEQTKLVRQKLHQTISKVTQDIPQLKFNTAIAAMMELINTWEDEQKRGTVGLIQEDLQSLIKILAPFAPFLAEELHQHVVDQNTQTFESVHLQSWPSWDESIAETDTIHIPVQVNGKVRDQLEVSRDLVQDEASVLEQAKSQPKISTWLEGKTIIRHIYVPGKILNIVVE